MNEQQLIAELRNSLQATTFADVLDSDGKYVKITKLLISDETQRAELTAKYVALLKSVSPAAEPKV